MECHRDEVVVRVSSIYDSLIGHGLTSALLEGGADSEIMRNTLYRETHIDFINQSHAGDILL